MPDHDNKEQVQCVGFRGMFLPQYLMGRIEKMGHQILHTVLSGKYDDAEPFPKQTIRICSQVF